MHSPKFEFKIECVTGKGPMAPCFVAITVFAKTWSPFRRKVAYASGIHRRPRGVFAQEPGIVRVIPGHPCDHLVDWSGDWDADYETKYFRHSLGPAIDHPDYAKFLQAISNSIEIHRAERDKAEKEAAEMARLETTPPKAHPVRNHEDTAETEPEVDEDEEIDDEDEQTEDTSTSPILLSYKKWTDHLLTTGEIPDEVPEAHRAVVIAMAEARVSDIKNKFKTS